MLPLTLLFAGFVARFDERRFCTAFENPVPQYGERMKFYLSSYKFGANPSALKDLFADSNSVGLIPNAMDYVGVNPERLSVELEQELAELRKLGLAPELVDLREYFGAADRLAAKLDSLDGIFVRGGNVFVLRQAMQLSGLDKYVRSNLFRTDFVYAGYSAGCCVLSRDLSAYATVDDSSNLPYPECREPCFAGLGILAFAFLPHFDSNHPEAAAVAVEVQNCIERKQLFKAYRDGEVEILELTEPQ